MKKLAILVLALVMCLTAVSAMAAVREVPTTTYPTVKAALSGIEDGDIIRLISDINGDGIDFKAKKKYTFDLNGHTYTVTGNLVGSSGTKTQAFRFYSPEAEVLVKNGTLAATNPDAIWLINSYSSKVIFENVKLDGSKLEPYSSTQVLHNNNGTMQIIGTSSVIAPEGYPAIVVSDSTASKYPGGATIVIDTQGLIDGNVTVTGGDAAKLIINDVDDNSKLDITVEKGDATMSNLPIGTPIENNGAGQVVANGVNVAPKNSWVIPAPAATNWNAPETGDTENLMMWVVLMAMAMVGLVATRKMSRQ